jgi:regulator of RNase E activity RraA
LRSAVVGDFRVTADDVVFGDADGVLFVESEQLEAIITTAESIRDTERAQAGRAVRGESLRSQFRFDAFLRRREADPSLTFRQHLRGSGGAVEE